MNINSPPPFNLSKILFFVILFCSALTLNGQISDRTSLDTLENELVNASKKNKLSILHQLISQTIDSKNYDLAKRYAFKLQSSLPNHTKDTFYLNSLKSLARIYYYQKKIDSSLVWDELYLNAVTEALTLKEKAWALNFRGILKKSQGSPIEAIENYEECIKVSKQIKDTLKLTEAFNNLGLVYQEIGNYPKAKESYEQSLLLKAVFTKDKVKLANSYLNFGQLHQSMGLADKAIEYYFIALRYYEDADHHWGIAAANNNIGIIYSDQKNYDKAKEFYENSLKIAKEWKLIDLLPNIYMNLGEIMARNDEKSKNVEYLLSALEILKADTDQQGMADVYTNLGISYTDMGKSKEAIDHLNRAKTIYNQLSSKMDEANTEVEIGRTLLLNKSYQNAIAHLNKGLLLSKGQGYLQVEAAAFEHLSAAYEKTGSFEKSHYNFKQYVLLKDSIDNIEKSKEITKIQSQYDQEKNLAEIQRLSLDQTNKELQISEQKRTQNKIVGTALLSLLALLGLLLYYRNRQHRKQIDFEKIRSQKLLQIDLLKDQFLANTSHELRTPLNGIIGLSESLIDGITGPLPAETVENLKLISSSGKRLSSLVNDILDFSKAKNKDLKLRLQPVDPYVVADVVIKSCNALISGRPIQLINQIPKDLPLVQADENRLQQILFNIVGNAIKFTDKGDITVSATFSGNNIIFKVTDTGIGIPPEKIPLIFKSFEQLDGAETREHGGTGLGLAVTKQLVELHHGKIEISSIVGEGSTFYFSIPLSKDGISYEYMLEKANEVTKLKGEAFKPNAILNPDIPSFKSDQSNKIKILTVDDEVINLKVLENHLLLEGYAVDKAFTGTEALAKVKETHYDLVILDVMMPNMSGFELCQRIRETYLMNKLPVIMLTAKNSITDLLRGFEAGVNDYLTKPFSKDELLSRIRTHLRLKNFYVAADKFVPIEFLKAIGRESITEAKIGDFASNSFTIMFSDIRNSTTLAEQFSPEENFRFINGFAGRMGPIIRKNKGFVNQYLGDAIMCIFPKKAEFALDAAIQMQQTMHAYNQERKLKNRPIVEIGVGLHTGDLIMGIIGDHERADPATLADSVNVASRIEGLTKYFGAKILVSDDTYNQIAHPEEYRFRSLGKIKLKGKTKALTIYECLDGDPPAVRAEKLHQLTNFNHAMKYFKDGDFDSARNFFGEILKINPEDQSVVYFQRRSEEYLASDQSKTWQGVEVMVDK